MSHSPLKDQHARVPVDKTAALVTSKAPKGSEYQWNNKSNCVHSDLPLPVKPFTGPEDHDLTGVMFGRMKVIGFYGRVGDKGMWSVKCVCGKYTVRSSKAIKNESNTDDMCYKCRSNQYHKSRKK